MTSCQFFKMAVIASQIYFRFLVWPRLAFKKVKSSVRTKFDDISQSTAETLLFLVSDNKQAPY